MSGRDRANALEIMVGFESDEVKTQQQQQPTQIVLAQPYLEKWDFILFLPSYAYPEEDKGTSKE